MNKNSQAVKFGQTKSLHVFLSSFQAINCRLNQFVSKFFAVSRDITNVKCYCTTPSAARAFLLTTIAATYSPRPQGTEGLLKLTAFRFRS